MHKNRPLLIPLLSLVFGALLGGGLATVYWLKATTRATEARYTLSTLERTRLLRQLRANKNQEAIVEQEILLSGDLVGLGFYVEHFQPKDPSSAEALLRANQYRAQFPLPPQRPSSGEAIP